VDDFMQLGTYVSLIDVSVQLET